MGNGARTRGDHVERAGPRPRPRDERGEGRAVRPGRAAARAHPLAVPDEYRLLRPGRAGAGGLVARARRVRPGAGLARRHGRRDCRRWPGADARGGRRGRQRGPAGDHLAGPARDGQRWLRSAAEDGLAGLARAGLARSDALAAVGMGRARAVAERTRPRPRSRRTSRRSGRTSSGRPGWSPISSRRRSPSVRGSASFGRKRPRCSACGRGSRSSPASTTGRRVMHRRRAAPAGRRRRHRRHVGWDRDLRRPVGRASRPFVAPAPLPGRWVVGGRWRPLGGAGRLAARSRVRRSLVDGRAAGRGGRVRRPAPTGSCSCPYLAGERAPIFDEAARGVFFGLTLAHGRGAPRPGGPRGRRVRAAPRRRADRRGRRPGRRAAAGRAGAPGRHSGRGSRPTSSACRSRCPRSSETAVLGAAILAAAGDGSCRASRRACGR